MTSLRIRLFLLVAAATAIVWALAAAWTVLSARADVERVLDRRLQEAAIMVASLGYGSQPTGRTSEISTDFIALPSHDRQLSCQIWSIGGKLLGASPGAPGLAMSNGKAGFSEREIGGNAWRVYTHVSPETGLQVMVGDTLAMRTQLIADLMRGLIVPAVIGLLALALLLWIGIGQGLAPLRRVATAIGNRGPEDQSPLDIGAVPPELTPLTREIDELFSRIAELRSAEKRFLASAAHEMQTPLAGLKTHAEIALRTPDEETRRKSLERIRQSVDRTTRLVRQLLDLSKERTVSMRFDSSSSLQEAFTEAKEELEHLIKQRGCRVHATAAAMSQTVPVPMTSLIIALRNLIENALIHGPPNGDVVLDAGEHGFSVADDGTGFSEDAGEALIKPFVRDPISKAPGSGLGLSIVASALEPTMTLHFERSLEGFRVSALRS